MKSDVQPIPRLSLASRAPLTAHDHLSGAEGASEVTGTLLDDPRPRRALVIDPAVDNGTFIDDPAVDDGPPRNGHAPTALTVGSLVTAPSNRAVGRLGRPLRTRLFARDVVTVAASWLWLGYTVEPGPRIIDRLAPGLVATVVTLVAMRATGLYRSRRCVRKSDELWRIALASIWGAAGFVVTQSELGHHGLQPLLCAGVAVVATGISRWRFGRHLRARRAEGRYLRPVVLVGSNADALALRTTLRAEPELGYVVAGVVGDCRDEHAWADLPSSPSVADIPHLAASTGASGVLVVPYAQSSTATEDAITTALRAGLHVQVWPGLRGVGSGRLRSVPLSREPFFYVEPRSSSRWQLTAKRAIDVVGASVGLFATLPVLALAAALIKLEDGGPVFHQAERVGLHGRPFRTLKFRSMNHRHDLSASDLAVVNERTDGPLFKASNDPRVTKVGHFLRSSSIDELPQLWNVLRGTMSLVGPRPALPNEVAQFDTDLLRRHSVRPGMTGLWQVEARQNPSFHAYRRLDLHYVDNWSLYLDISILFATVPAIASQAVGSLRASRDKA